MMSSHCVALSFNQHIAWTPYKNSFILIYKRNNQEMSSKDPSSKIASNNAKRKKCRVFLYKIKNMEYKKVQFGMSDFFPEFSSFLFISAFILFQNCILFLGKMIWKTDGIHVNWKDFFVIRNIFHSCFYSILVTWILFGGEDVFKGF